MDVSTTINSTENFSIISLLNENRSVQYNLDSSNYGVYFALWATPPNSTEIPYKQLERYFQIEYKYSPSGVPVDHVDIEGEDCKVRKMNDFLNLEYNKTLITEEMANPWRICVKNPIKMGLFAHPEYSMVFIPSLFLQIKQCRNSSLNNNFCASLEEIKEMKKYTQIQSSIPKAIFDFKNQSNLIKRVYKNEYYYLDLNLKKTIKSELNPTFLYKDYGLFNDDYRLDSINFDIGQQTIDFNSKDSNDDVIFEYFLSFSFQNDKYYIRNQKLNEMLGSFGGMISVLYSIGSLFCFFINRILLTNSLISLSFKCNRPKEKNASKMFPSQSKSKGQSTIANDQEFHFSFLSAIFSYFKFRRKKDPYLKSKKLLNEYIDFEKIIQRLQDLDKLKYILLTDYQRFLFDQIPKPTILGCFDEKTTKTTFGENHILKSKTKEIAKQGGKKSVEYFCHDALTSEIDKKIVSMLDYKVISKLNLEAKTSKSHSNSDQQMFMARKTFV